MASVLDQLAGRTFTSDNFTTSNVDNINSILNYSDPAAFPPTTWTQDNSTVGGNGTVEQVQIVSVNDTYNVVELNITRPDNSTYTIYGQVIGYNAYQIAFNLYTSFDPSTGNLGGSDPDVSTFYMAPTVLNPDDTQFGYDAVTTTNANTPLFTLSAPAPNLDLTNLNGATFGTDYVAVSGSVTQDPNSRALSVQAGLATTTLTADSDYGAGSNSAYVVSIANVYNSYQVLEIQIVSAANQTVTDDFFGKVIGYDGDSLLLESYDTFDPTTGLLGNHGSNGNPNNAAQVEPEPSQPYLVLSDTSLVSTNGVPPGNAFTTTSASAPFGTVAGEGCFAAGTRLRTPAGDVAVEHLRAGDCVVTHAGDTRRIVWTGHRSIDLRRHRRAEAVRPIRISAGAFADFVPACDVLLSPDHAVFVEGMLIPVRELVNGATIAPEAVDSVTYYHVELETHDVLLAEGLPAESYLDIDSRRHFSQAGAAMTLHPQFGRPDRALATDWVYLQWESRGCARLVVWGPELDRARALLAARAARLHQALPAAAAA
jgi:hypothetical protein